jgi:membrane-associated PAP2 superfamily phosphatase
MWNAMSDGSDPDKILARQARLVSIVIAVTMLGWMGAQWVGGRLGLPDRYVFLVDLFALAGFLWALIVTFQIWRKRRDN